MVCRLSMAQTDAPSRGESAVPGLFLCAALAPKAFVHPLCGPVRGLDGRGNDSQKTKSRQDAHHNCRKKIPNFHGPATVAIWVYRNQAEGALLSKTGGRISCAKQALERCLLVSHQYRYCEFRYAMKSAVSCMVILPGLPLPTGRLLISVIGTISAAVPVAKHSSQTYKSCRTSSDSITS